MKAHNKCAFLNSSKTDFVKLVVVDLVIQSFSTFIFSIGQRLFIRYAVIFFGIFILLEQF